MALVRIITFNPCCGSIESIQFQGNSLDYVDGSTYIYNGQCYTVDLSFTNESSLPEVPTYGGVLGEVQEPDTAYLLPLDGDCNSVSCPECIAYNFVNCYDETLVFQGYLTNSEDIPALPFTIELDSAPFNTGTYLNCWTVTEIPEGEAVLETYTIIAGHTDCFKCTAKNNLPPCIALTNCITGEVLLLSTTEAFRDYLGKVIKVELITESGIEIVCFEVSLSDTCPELPAALPGQIIDCFTKCEDCVPKCSCTRAVNNGNIAKRLEYLDCNGITQLTEEIVGVGRRSKKYCTLEWTDPDVVEVINFGDCVDNTCPEIPLPKRVVTPGYDTPICTPAQYERIVCKYAEIKYKEVLTKRYGIEDCCDDESLANDIKYELIHLQMLEDPEYVCVNNPRLCPPGCGYINMNIIHECVIPEIEIYEYRLTIDGTPNPAAGSIINYTDENGLAQSYTVVVFREAFEITFCAVYGSITINGNAYYASNEPCPTAPCTAFAGLLLERIGDCPA